MVGVSSKRPGGGAESARSSTPKPAPKQEHRWSWGMVDGGAIRRTALVRVQWVEGRDGPFLRTGTSGPLLATLCVCSLCGTLRADVEHPDGGPTLHAYGVDVEGLLAGCGSPRCEPLPRRGNDEEGGGS